MFGPQQIASKLHVLSEYFIPSSQIAVSAQFIITESFVVEILIDEDMCVPYDRLYICKLVCSQFSNFNERNISKTYKIQNKMPVPSSEPVIQWLSFVYVLHIIYSFILYT